MRWDHSFNEVRQGVQRTPVVHGAKRRLTRNHFALIADMPNYGRWLPGSKALGGRTEVSPYPVRLGTTYLDAGPVDQRPGSVTGFPKLEVKIRRRKKIGYFNKLLVGAPGFEPGASCAQASGAISWKSFLFNLVFENKRVRKIFGSGTLCRNVAPHA